MYRLSMRPLTIETPCVLFDISRLLRSVARPFGTGVDRIDLAIGLDLAARFGQRCHFLHAGLHGVHHLSQADGVAVLRHLDARWNDAPGSALGAAQRARITALPWKSRMVRGFRAGIVGNDTTYVVASHSGLGKVKGGMKRLDPEARMKRIVYLHDLIPIDYPEYQRPETLRQFTAYLTELLDAPAAIVANSQDTAERAAAYGRAHALAFTRIEVIIPTLDVKPAHGVAPRAAVSAFLADPRPYFIAVGTIEPRKNHLLLLQIWRTLLAKSDAPRLCIVGKRGWENENVLDMLDRCPGLKGHVFEFGGLSDGEVQAMLRQARALLFPSFAEGLGIPLLEAAALGVQAIVSDIAVFHEIAPSGTVFLDPLDGLGWMREILARSGNGPASIREDQA